jgi:uncharacterized protein YdaU (DUF1376 family)
MRKRKLCQTDDLRVDMFLPLFCRDFLMSTIGWTAAQRGHYLTLLMVQWDAGFLPPNLDALDRISDGVSDAWNLLEDKFPVGTDGQRRNLRLEEHRANAVELREKRKKSGQEGGKAKAKQTSSKGVAPLEHCQSDAVAKPYHPEPEPEPHTLSLTRESSTATADPPTGSVTGQRQAGYAAPAWEALLNAWNAAAARCKHIGRYDSLYPPRAFHDRLGELGWEDDWSRGIERLERCRWFTTPVSLTFFLKEDTLAAILGGAYDDKKPTKPGEHVKTGPVVSSRMWRDDACQNMTDEQYVAWRKKQAAPLAR